MFELQKTFHFEAGHSLEHHDGKCRGPHGHSYILTIHLASETLTPSGPKKNMIVDLTDVSLIAEKMVKEFLDHHWLNDSLDNDSPTIEFISRWVFDHLKPQLPNLRAVSLNETATSKVIYRPPV